MGTKLKFEIQNPKKLWKNDSNKGVYQTKCLTFVFLQGLLFIFVYAWCIFCSFQSFTIYILFVLSNICIFNESTIYIYMHNLLFVALYCLSFTYFVWSNFCIFIGLTQQFLNCSSFLLLRNPLFVRPIFYPALFL